MSSSGLFDTVAAHRSARAPATARWVVMVVVLFLAAAVCFAAVTPLKALVRAEGEVMPDGRLMQVEHLTGGIVREVHVREGAVVAKGDILAVLDDPVLSADIRQSGQALQQVRSRLGAVQTLLSALGASGLDAEAVEMRVSQASVAPGLAAEHAAARLEVFLARHAVIEARIEQISASIATLRMAAEIASERVAAQAEQVRRLELLRAKGHVPEFRLVDARDRQGELRGEQAAAAVQLARAIAEQRDATAELSLQVLSLREDLLGEIAELEREEQRLAQLFSDLRRRQASLIVTSPDHGVIQSVAFPAVGEIMGPDAVMFELLPSDARLVAEIRLTPGDIGHVARGAKVDFKVKTFDFRRYGGVSGTIEALSPSRVTERDGTQYYRATVALDRSVIGSETDPKPLRPGMELAAEIQTQSRTVLQYLLKPIDNALQTAMTER